MATAKNRSAKPRTLTIGGDTIPPGESRVLHLGFSESYLGTELTMPVFVQRAEEPGPIVLLTGAIHGDELAGIGIIRELLYDQPPALLKGTLICVPVVNVFGLENHSRYATDRRDLNRCFPGSSTGSLSSRLAHTLLEEIVVKCDCCIDFHSAAVRRTNYPNVRANLNNERVKRLALAFGCELVVSGGGPEGSLRRWAVKRGVPTIILEAGEVWKNEPGVVEVGVRGVENVLRTLGMIAGDPVPPLFQVTISKTTWMRAPRGGFLGYRAKPGDLVKRGQVLGSVTSTFGREREDLTSPATGIVLGVTTMPAVKPGDPVYHIARLSRNKFKQITETLERARDDHPFIQIQEDLSTSLTMEGEGERAL